MKCHVSVIEQVSIITVVLCALFVMLRDRQLSSSDTFSMHCNHTLVVQRSVSVRTLDETSVP